MSVIQNVSCRHSPSLSAHESQTEINQSTGIADTRVVSDLQSWYWMAASRFELKKSTPAAAEQQLCKHLFEVRNATEVRPIISR